MEAFRIKLPTLWRQAFPGLMAGALLARLSQWVQGEPFSLPSTLPLMAAAALMVVLIHLLQPTLVGAQGLKLMTPWGFRRSLRWDEVQSVSLGRAYFVQPSLKVLDIRGRMHWIAQDTKDLAGMHRRVLEFAGAQHALARALETPLYALHDTRVHHR